MPSQEGKNFQYRDTHILLAGVRGYTPDPVSKSPGNTPDRHAMTLGSPWIRFASPAKVEARSASDSPVDSLSQRGARTVLEHITVDLQRRRIAGEHSDEFGILQGESN